MDSTFPAPPTHTNVQHTMTQAADLLIQAATTALRDESARMLPSMSTSADSATAPASASHTTPSTPFRSEYPPHLSDTNFLNLPRHIGSSFLQQNAPQSPSRLPTGVSLNPLPQISTHPAIPVTTTSYSSTGRTWDPMEADRPTAEKFVEQNAVFCKGCGRYRQFRKDQANIGTKYKSRRFRCCSCMSNYLRVADIMAAIKALEGRSRKRGGEDESEEVGEEEARRKRMRVRRKDDGEEGVFVMPPPPTETEASTASSQKEKTPQHGLSGPNERPASHQPSEQGTPSQQTPIPTPSVLPNEISMHNIMMTAQSSVATLISWVESLVAENRLLRSEVTGLREKVNRLEQSQKNIFASLVVDDTDGLLGDKPVRDQSVQPPQQHEAPQPSMQGAPSTGGPAPNQYTSERNVSRGLSSGNLPAGEDAPRTTTDVNN